MTLKGIDVSAWQSGIDLSAVDADFVIVKADGGTEYDNPDFSWQAERALASGKLLGCYHFAGDGSAGSAAEEARHFLEAFEPYIGKAIPILDWEAEATSWPVSWAAEWLSIVASETGATPWFYSYSSYVNGNDLSALAGYPLWIAAYYAGYAPMGYQDDPPLYGGTGAWDRWTCYQYTSSGRISGYGGNLDLNIFDGGRDEWEAYCGGGTMGTAKGLIDVAYSYLGTTEDDPRFVELIEYYNEHTDGYDMALWDEWCACFVSVCSLKSGNADATGTSVNCAVFRNIWQSKGIYREAWETPEAGWLIDYDWQKDGIPDHIGIVVDCDGETIHVIEGNTDGETCAEHWVPVGSPSISCFAAPRYEGAPKPHQEPGEPANDAGLWYRAHCQDLDWCDPVHDGQVAGTVGFGLRMEAIKVTPPEGWVLDIAVHCANVGWKHYRGIERGVKDPIIGTVGKSQAIEAIVVRVASRPKGDKRKLKFRVHQANTGWKAWTKEGFASGSDGLGIQLEAIQMKLV